MAVIRMSGRNIIQFKAVLTACTLFMRNHKTLSEGVKQISRQYRISLIQRLMSTVSADSVFVQELAKRFDSSHTSSGEQIDPPLDLQSALPRFYRYVAILQ